jgi:catechol 2,3-dioxygenase-like lactoylglutathione lyase family enzyme
MQNPSLMSHVSVGVADLARAAAFYDAALAPLGGRRILDEGSHGIGYGRHFPEFWIGPPHDGGTAAPGNGVHIAFAANSHAEVDQFYAAAIAAGASDDGPPGPRPHYGEEYYGAFVRDPDGNKIEAMIWEGPAT